MKTVFLASCVAISVFAAAIPAGAASFALNPTTISLANATSGDLVVTDLGAEPVRLSVRAYAWQQTTSDSEVLNQSDRVPYFPQLLTLTPGASQRIRVGVLDARGPVERAYRIIVTELPAPRTATPDAAGLQVLKRIDIPLFLTPNASQPSASSIAAVVKRADGVDVSLANDGNAHIGRSAVSLVGRDADGRVRWQQTQQAFYVLAQSRITVHVPVASALLRSTRSVDVLWKRPLLPSQARTATL